MILEARAIIDSDMIRRMTERFRDRDVLVWRSVLRVICMASLAHHGLLGSVNMLSLGFVDLSPVPTQHLVSLASCVTRYLCINEVSGCDLVSLLKSVKCRILHIRRQTLGRELTQALVQAMESRVEKLRLCEFVRLGDKKGEGKVDIEALTEYSGQGRCRTLEVTKYKQTTYQKELRHWAKSRNWRVNSKDRTYDIYQGPSK